MGPGPPFAAYDESPLRSRSQSFGCRQRSVAARGCAAEAQAAALTGHARGLAVSRLHARAAIRASEVYVDVGALQAEFMVPRPSYYAHLRSSSTPASASASCSGRILRVRLLPASTRSPPPNSCRPSRRPTSSVQRGALPAARCRLCAPSSRRQRRAQRDGQLLRADCSRRMTVSERTTIALSRAAIARRDRPIRRARVRGR